MQESLWDFAMLEWLDLRQLYGLNGVGSVLILLLLILWVVNSKERRGKEGCKRSEERVMEENWLVSLCFCVC